nr:hypothetical protein BaRGS_003072 [Batillaria attramentaria]
MHANGNGKFNKQTTGKIPTVLGLVSSLCDVRDDKAQVHVLHCLQELAEKRREVMFVMSQLDFDNYLSEPCYSGAVSQMKRPVDLSGQKLDKGDFDVLIVHRNYGLCAGEIKSVGFNAADRKLSEQQIQDEVLKVLRKMLKLQKTGTGKTLTAVIMGVEWMRRNKTVDILSGDRKSRAAAHHIKQQLEETARLVIGPQAASRVRLNLVHLDKGGAKLAANVDKLGPGHVEYYSKDCQTCGREVGRILTQVLHVGQGGNTSSSSTTALQYRDVFVLSWDSHHDDVRDDAGHVTRPANGVVRGLRQAGVPGEGGGACVRAQARV